MSRMPSISDFLITLMLILSLLCAFPSAVSGNDDGIVAAQILILEGKDIGEVSLELDKIKAAGFNTVFLRIFQNQHDRYHRITGINDEEKYDHGSGVYFQSELAPVVYDLLTPISRLCKEKGLKFFAWMTTRQMDWLDSPDLMDQAFVDAKGELTSSSKFDLFDPRFQIYLFNIYAELASKEIDGIILQDDFVIMTREGFTKAGLKEFFARTFTILSENLVTTPGFFPEKYGEEAKSSSKLFHQWSVFKAGYVASLGERLVEKCKEENPDLQLGINLYYDSAMFPAKGVQWLGQDLELVTNSSFDYVLTMSYHRQISSELSLSVTEAIEIISDFNNDLFRSLDGRLILKIQTVDWTTGEEIPAEELMMLSRVLPTGLHNFAVAPVESNGIILQQLKKIFTIKSSKEVRNEQ